MYDEGDRILAGGWIVGSVTIVWKMMDVDSALTQWSLITLHSFNTGLNPAIPQILPAANSLPTSGLTSPTRIIILYYNYTIQLPYS